MNRKKNYQTRSIDASLNELLPHFRAIVLEGPKGVGKTETALQRATSEIRLDRVGVPEQLEANPGQVTNPTGTLLIDEWQRWTPVWDMVRRAVDDGAPAGSFLLTGSAFPAKDAAIHSGAARIDSLRMRPFSLPERFPSLTKVRLNDIFDGTQPEHSSTEVDFDIDYGVEICRSGFPSIMELPERLRASRLETYLNRVATHEFRDQGLNVRNPQAVLRWLGAYAASTSQTDSYSEILNRATPGESDNPSRKTADNYRNLLEQLMILEPLSAWMPFNASVPALAQRPKHHLCDPALAATLLGATSQSLTRGDGKQAHLFAQLLESLAVLTARVAAESIGAKVYHLRTRKGEHEVDMVVENYTKQIIGIEVKVSPVVRDDDVRHLLWLQEIMGEKFAGGIVVHAGRALYQRPDGIWVVPLACLG